jgi:hypothetical protein
MNLFHTFAAHCINIQYDQKEMRAVLKIIVSHVEEQLYAHKRSMDGSKTLLYNKSYLMNFRRWNYNCTFYYYYQIMEKIYKINKTNILH